jgi:hypothetical protein
MKKAMIALVFLFAVALIGTDAVLTATAATIPSAVERASMGGRYTDLLEVLDAPQDAARYGDVYELGYQNRTSYGGYGSLPSGYWVYVKPSWYIWKTKTGEKGGSLDYTKASVNGKYETILKTFSVPADRDRFGEFYDWGLRTVTTYGKNKNLPTGYWVYAHPYWYIWKTKTEEKQTPDYTKGSIDGKYRTILKTIYSPKDKAKFGEIYEWGYRDATSYGGTYVIPKGYWVYAHPYWYIWDKKGKKERKEKTTTDEKRASVDGKYRNLLKTLSVPRDRDGYGEFFEFGYANDKEYEGYTGLPPGYWVYVYPHWYIWKDLKGSPGPGPGPAPGPTSEEKKDPRSAYGKYYSLKKQISVPLDVIRYGNYYDRGYSTGRDYGSATDLPSGYWVYVFPTWYVWEKEYPSGK